MTPYVSRVPATALALALLAAVGVAPQAYAQSSADKAAIDAAKARGVVGEQADGFLGVVSVADPAVRSAMTDINDGRASAYRNIAAKTGVSPAAAGQATARELFGHLPAGQFYKTANGEWTRR